MDHSNKNVIVIVLDMLSKWYIDQVKEEGSFFGRLEKNSYCAENMYSVGPFTESAAKGMWASENHLDGQGSIFAVRGFRNMPFYELFRKNGYQDIYLGGMPFLTDQEIAEGGYDGWANRTERGTVKGRLAYYAQIKKQGQLKEGDYKVLEIILEKFFYIFRNDIREEVKIECDLFRENKRLYIEEILSDFAKQDFLQRVYANSYRESAILDMQQIVDVKPSDEERKLESLLKYKDIEYLLGNDHFNTDTLEKILDGTDKNRDLFRSTNAIRSMRFPGGFIGRDFTRFLEWYDARESGEKYLAYIHNHNFHGTPIPYFMDHSYEEGEAYQKEVEEKIRTVEDLTYKKMSIVKQLSILNIEENLTRFWDELKKRGIFDDTYVIVTADHGTDNTIHQKDRLRWEFSRKVMHVPFYLTGSDVVPAVDYNFYTNKDILPTLVQMCDLQTFDNQYEGKALGTACNKYVWAAWMNDVCDLYRNRIKIGIRNQSYSITCYAQVTQFFDSWMDCTAYDLRADPDELRDVYSSVRDRDDFIALYNELKDKWFDTIYDLLTDADNPWQFSHTYSFLAEKKEAYRQYNKTLRKIPRDEFDRLVDGKQLVFIGAGEGLRSFLKAFGCEYQVREVWDNNPQMSGKYIIGAKVCTPHADIEQDNTVFVVTSRFELEFKEQLDGLGIRNYIFWLQIEQEYRSA